MKLRSLFLLLAACPASVWAEAAQPNFLIIAIDDLNSYVGALGGHPDASTPNLDQLASQGVLFTRAYCNSPVCNPSRASIWTGLRPTTTGVTSNPFGGWFRDKPGLKDIRTLPQALAGAGYSTAAYGKLLHLGHGNKLPGEFQHLEAFDYGPKQAPKLNFTGGDALSDWGVPDRDDEGSASHDPKIADRVVAFLRSPPAGPFVLGCGFFRPHTPLYTTQKWIDLHPLEKISLPPGFRADDNSDLVYFGRRDRDPRDIEAPGLFDHEWIVSNGKWHEVIQAYLAATSAMDAQLGRVISAWQSSPARDNTYVILFSDHGWDLGEKFHWGKAALWETTTRVPFIIAGPGIPEGVRCETPVGLLNIYPTVIDYAGVEPPHKLDGVSMRPLLEDVTGPWNRPVLTTFVNHHALRTLEWRYIRYATGEEELYDHRIDPHEFENLAFTRANDPAVRATLAEMRVRLDELLP